MRFVIIVMIWLGLGAVYWWMSASSSLECCENETAIIPADTNQNEALKWPIRFSRSSWKPVLSRGFTAYRDSITGSVADDEVLNIFGSYGVDESNTSQFDNLGLARAEAMKYILAKQFEQERIYTFGESRRDSFDQNAHWLRFEFEKIASRIEEIDNRTLIYFPNNSNDGLIDKEVSDYLERVAERVRLTGEKISLTGHSDSFGKASYNHRLGLHRAYAIRRILVKRGVPVRDIMVSSKGEMDPIATNSTEDGRSKNRRVELVITE